MLENKDNRTELSELGEFGLIDHIAGSVELKNKSSLKGIGDDAAVIDNFDGTVTLVSTDALIEGIHFDLTYSPLKHLGYKAVVVNLSDIAAMNGRPEQITVSVGISNRFSLEAVEELYAGILLACNKYEVDLIGGDTTSSRSGLFLSITAIGKANKEDVVYRNGSSEKELIVVTGDLGGAYMGLQILEREKEVFKANPGMQPDLDGYDYILERQLKPEARVDVVDMLRQLEVKPTSMIDISDGLASEIKHLCKASGNGCDLFIEKIPIDPTVIRSAEEFNLDPITCALNGGEDYELLFTIRQSDFEKIKGNPHLTVIGYMTEKGGKAQLVTPAGEGIEIKAQGWKHF